MFFVFVFLSLLFTFYCILSPHPPPVILLLTVPTLLFCFGPFVVLDVVCGYVLLFLFDIKIENR